MHQPRGVRHVSHGRAGMTVLRNYQVCHEPSEGHVASVMLRLSDRVTGQAPQRHSHSHSRHRTTHRVTTNSRERGVDQAKRSTQRERGDPPTQPPGRGETATQHTRRQTGRSEQEQQLAGRQARNRRLYQTATLGPRCASREPACLPARGTAPSPGPWSNPLLFLPGDTQQVRCDGNRTAHSGIHSAEQQHGQHGGKEKAGETGTMRARCRAQWQQAKWVGNT